MTERLKPCVEFLQSTFKPRILVLATPDVDRIAAKNGLTFAEVLTPFSSVQSSTYLKDPLNQTLNIDVVKLKFVDGAEVAQDQAARRVLGDAVGGFSSFDDCDGLYSPTPVSASLETPWFETWRSLFLDLVPPGDHEFLEHVVGCLFVISERDPPHESVSLLYKKLHQELKSKTFFNSPLNYYVVVHDAAAGDPAMAEKKCEMLRSHHGYGAASVVKLNSAKDGDDLSKRALPELWSHVLARKKAFEKPKPKKWTQTPVEEEEIAGSLPCIDATGMSGLSSGLSSPAEYATEAAMTSVDTTPNFQAVTMHPLSPDASPGNFLGPKNDIHGNVVLNEDHLPTPVAGEIFEDDASSGQMEAGRYLSTADLETLRVFLQHYVSKALIPYVERQMKVLHEAVGSRKGLHRSIVSATKKWFTPAAKIAPGSNANTVLYGPDAPELQTRKLADLCFLFRHYDLAYQAYHNAKREFDSDQAWVHMAGALEMAAVSAFLHATIQSQGVPTPETYKQLPQRYFDMAISSYLNVCRLPDYAARTALYSTECLKARNLWGEAALTYIRLSGEDSDLRSALFLEQAALCFLRCASPSFRKFGFHMVLAGHRFYKSGQKRHTVRAYCQALQVYRTKGWQLAEDHINYTIGRQARCLNHLSTALAALSALITSTAGQKPNQQEAFLREFLLTYQKFVDAHADGSSSLPELPLPVVEANRSQVLVPGPVIEAGEFCGFPASPATNVSFNDDLSKEAIWVKLEEILIEETQKSTPLPSFIFQPTMQRFCDGTINSVGPMAFVGEPLFVEISLKNPLNVSLTLADVQLICDFVQKEEVGVSGNDQRVRSDVVQSELLPSVVMDPSSETKLNLNVTVVAEGELNVTGLSYKLRCSPNSVGINGVSETGDGLMMSTSVNEECDAIFAVGRQEFRIAGPRLNSSKQERCSVMYGVDKRFCISVFAPRLALECRLIGVPTRMLRNEIRSCFVCLTNSGSRTITRISLCLKDPQCFVVGNAREFAANDEEMKTFLADSVAASSSPCFVTAKDDEHEDLVRIGSSKRPRNPFVTASLNKTPLAVGQSLVVPVWIRAPCVSGRWASQALFSYDVEGGFGGRKRRNRVVRHTFEMDILPSVSMIGSVHRCPRLVSDDAGDKTDSFNVVLETKNDCRASDPCREATLVQLSAVSSCVRLAKNAVHEPVRLKPQERHHFFVQVERNGVNKDGLVLTGSKDVLFISSTTSVSVGEGDAAGSSCGGKLSPAVVDFASKSSWQRLEEDTLSPVYPDLAGGELSSSPSIYSSSIGGGPGAANVDSSFGSGVAPMSFRGPRITRAPDEEEEEERRRGPPPLLRVLCLWSCSVKETDGSEREAWGFSMASLRMKERDGVTFAGVRRQSASGIAPVDTARFLSAGLDFANLLKCRFTHPVEYVHNFGDSRICVVPVTLFVQNCTPVEVCLTLDVSNEAGRDQGGNLLHLPRPSNAFALVGRRVKRGLKLRPGELSEPVDLKAAFVRPGAYNLAHLPPLLGVAVTGSKGTRGEERWIRAVISESLLVVRSA